MDGIVEQLLRLEEAKHKALLKCDSATYELHVSVQMRLFESAQDFAAAARRSTKSFAALARLIRLNTSLVLNLLKTSAAFARVHSGYTSTGNPGTRNVSRFRAQG